MFIIIMIMCICVYVHICCVYTYIYIYIYTHRSSEQKIARRRIGERSDIEATGNPGERHWFARFYVQWALLCRILRAMGAALPDLCVHVIIIVIVNIIIMIIIVIVSSVVVVVVVVVVV